ncbi:MAG: TipAS antibiotic-recognition domain-containing protein [Rhodomicrobiaceae bacterium]
MWGRPCDPDAYTGLADLYLAHPDFVARYESIAPGFAKFLATAMIAHAKRRANVG